VTSTGGSTTPRLVPLSSSRRRHPRLRAVPRVLTHGFVVDGKGEAMHSRRERDRTEEIIRKHGAELLRLWSPPRITGTISGCRRTSSTG